MTHQHTYDSELFNPQCHECGKIMRVDGTDLSVAEDLLWLKWKDEGSLCVTFVADCLLAGEDNKGRTKDMSFLTKKLRCFIKQEIRQALESQMSDLRKEVESIKPPEREINHHQSYNEGKVDALDEVLLLMKKESLQNCIECGEVVEEHESVKNCHGLCLIKVS